MGFVAGKPAARIERDPVSDLDEYRRAQRSLRRVFDGLTATLCPDCEDPCCRVPARVAALDVMIALAGGWNRETVDADPVVMALDQASYALKPGEEAAALPCPFLKADGCVFPGDLRPLECSAYVCKYMLAAMDARQRAHVRRLVADMRRAHGRIFSTFEARLRRRSRESKDIA